MVRTEVRKGGPVCCRWDCKGVAAGQTRMRLLKAQGSYRLSSSTPASQHAFRENETRVLKYKTLQAHVYCSILFTVAKI